MLMQEKLLELVTKANIGVESTWEVGIRCKSVCEGRKEVDGV